MSKAKFEVKQFLSRDGFRIYRITHRALPYLVGQVYLILGDSSFPPTLVDAGSSEDNSRKDILRGFEEIRAKWGEKITPEDIETLVLTHSHIDHFSGAYYWKEIAGAEVCAHPFDAHFIESAREREEMARAFYGEFLRKAGMNRLLVETIYGFFKFILPKLRSVEVDRRIEEGDTVNGFPIYHFPGHCDGHIALQVGEYIFSGDILLSGERTMAWPESIFSYCGLARTLDSLRKLDALLKENESPVILLPGHGEEIAGGRERIQEVLLSEEHDNDRLVSIYENSEKEPTCMDLSNSMYLARGISEMLLAICNTSARIEYLRNLGRLPKDCYAGLFGNALYNPGVSAETIRS